MENEIVFKITLDAFSNNIKRATKLIHELSDKQISQEISPTKNTGHYLIGHLITVHDNMLPLLGLGESLYPELVDVFLKNPDKSELSKPSIEQLRKQWDEVHNTLLTQLKLLTPAQWLEKHKAVSDEDFAKEPNRNKLNVVLSRTNHLSYHLGQIALLKN